MQAQIANFVNTVGSLKVGDLPPVVDLEVPEDWAKIAKSKRVKLVLQWLQGVEAKIGVRPIVYINNSMAKDILGSPASLKDYILWLAYYTTGPTAKIPAPWKSWTFWQHSETGGIAGIAGKVDLDRFAGTAAELAKLQLKSMPMRKALTVRESFVGWWRSLFGRIGL